MALKKAKKKIGLTTKIFIALIAGAILGIILFNLPAGSVRDDIVIDGILYVIGQGFIKLMKMLVVPLVFCSLVCGSMAIGDTKKLGSVGVRTIVFYLFTILLTALNILAVFRPSFLIKRLKILNPCLTLYLKGHLCVLIFFPIIMPIGCSFSKATSVKV